MTWSSNLEQTSRVYLCAFWNTHTVDNSRHRSRERLPGQRAKWNVVFGRGPRQPTIESDSLPVSNRARLRRHVLRRARKHHSAGRDRRHDRCWPNSGVHWDDTLPHTAQDLDLPAISAGAFSRRPSAWTATSSGRVEAGAGGLGRVAQEILGRKTLPRVWGNETQRRIHQSAVEARDLSCLQRMHSAEARGRNTLPMHPVRSVARRGTFCVKAPKPAVEHVSRLSVVRRKKAMFFMPGKADERILQSCSLANTGSEASIVFTMPNQDPRLLEMRGLPPAPVTAALFLLYFQAALWRRWNADMRHMPRCEGAACSPQARCCFQYSPPRVSPEKTSPQPHYPADMGSNCRKQALCWHGVGRPLAGKQ